MGMAIGYDWLYNWMTPEKRKFLEEQMYEKGINDYILGYQGRNYGMLRGIVSNANWCMVLNGGGCMLGMSLFDVYPDECAYIISNSVRGLESCLDGFAPHGIWFEGIGYAGMALEFLGCQMDCLEKLSGATYTIDSAEGLSESPRATLYEQSPLGAFPYQDNSGAGIQNDATMFYLADYFNDHGVIGAWFQGLGGQPQGGDLVRTMIWHKPEAVNATVELSPDIYSPGNEVVTARDKWGTDTKTFVGMKGGSPQLPHAHMYMGDFQYYANGVRWTAFVGAEDYNLPGYWRTGDDDLRWSYYGLRAEAKNCLVINPDQRGGFMAYSNARFTRFESKPRGMIAVLDMTDAYGEDRVSSASRSYYLTDNRRSFVVRDEAQLKKESELLWFLQTEQEVEIDGNSIILYQKINPSNKVRIDFATSAPIEISVGEAKPLPTSPNPEGLRDTSSIKRITVKMTASSNASITAKFTPSDVEGDDVSKYDVSSSLWTVPDGDLPSEPKLDTLVIDVINYDVNNKNTACFYKVSKMTVPPQIIAESSVYDVEIVNAKTLADTSYIILRGENGAQSKYTINFYETPEVKIDGYTEADIISVSASAIPQPENGIENVTDRDFSTRWSAEDLQYIVIDLGKEVAFDAVAMAFYSGDSRSYGLKISVSNNNEDYSTVFEGNSSASTNDFEHFAFEAQKARYIKIEGNGSSANKWNSWTEVAVLSKK